MSPALLDAPVRLSAESADPARVSGGRMTLEQRLDRTWRTLQAQGAAECPLCHSRMSNHGSAGECGGCGTRLG
jgi:hypothetical protein